MIAGKRCQNVLSKTCYKELVSQRDKYLMNYELPLHQCICSGWGANSALPKGGAEKIAPKASASKCNIYHATEPPCLWKVFTQLWALKLKNG